MTGTNTHPAGVQADVQVRGRRAAIGVSDGHARLPQSRGHDETWPSIWCIWGRDRVWPSNVPAQTHFAAPSVVATRSLASAASLQTTCKPRPCCAAFSLLEAVVSTLLIGLLLVAAMRTAGSSARASLANAHYAAAVLLAESLIAEVLACPYTDPDQAAVFGPEEGENTGSRSAFDDVDDFHGWSASPPELPDGTPLTGYEGWRRTVSVVYVQPNNLVMRSALDTGIKQITVTVQHDGKTLAQLVGIRTNAQ